MTATVPTLTREQIETLRERLQYFVHEDCQTVEAKAEWSRLINALCYMALASRSGGVWIPVSERFPEAPHGMLLVTNNIDARDAHGFMSHLWLVRMIHHNETRGYYAFDDYDNILPENITHWRLAASGGKGEG